MSETPAFRPGDPISDEMRRNVRDYLAAAGLPTIGVHPTAKMANRAAAWIADGKPVPAPHYPDPIPRDDQDADRARAGLGAEVPAQTVRPADRAEDDRD